MHIKNKYIKGFSLIELLITIIIMSLVTSSMFLLFNNVHRKTMQERVVSDLNSYVKGVFLYLDATLSAAEGDSIKKITSANGFNAYKFDFANIHNSWYNDDLGDFFNDDNCSTESGCSDYNWDGKVCREICTDITIKCSQEEGILFNNIPIWKYADFRGKPFIKNDPMSLAEYEIEDFSISRVEVDKNIGIENELRDNYALSNYLITLRIGIDNSKSSIISNSNSVKEYYNFNHRVFCPAIFTGGI